MPARTESRRPGLSEAIDGVPQAAASMIVMPHPSLGDGKTFAHAVRKSRSFSSSLTKPRNRTASDCPAAAASCFSSSR